MLCSGSGQGQITRSNLPVLFALVLLGGIKSSAAQTAPVSHHGSVQNSTALPQACLSPDRSSEQISMLLETLRSHPTAGAYNTLGALYAAGGQVNCAIPAFQASLRLEAKNWEAHYNLALAFLN